MERRYFEQKKGRVEIIPMIDIMLFLLVFFHHDHPADDSRQGPQSAVAHFQ